MSTEFLWRYLTIDKYERLLESRSIYFPRASRLSDSLEGSWLGYVLHTTDYENRIKNLPNHISTLESILLNTKSSDSLLQLKCLEILSKPDQLPELVNSIFCHAVILPVERVRSYLQLTISNWYKAIETHERGKKVWIEQIKLFRDATYISCWCKSEHISDLMWTSFCDGDSGVAIRIRRERLDELLSDNSKILAKYTLSFSVSDVTYLANLERPTSTTLEEVSALMMSVPVSGIVQFLVKSSIYTEENELRAILYPKRKMKDPLVNPNPNMNALNLPISPCMGKKDALCHFVDKVCIHPLLSESDPITSRVRQLHALHGLEQLPLEILEEKGFSVI